MRSPSSLYSMASTARTCLTIARYASLTFSLWVFWRCRWRRSPRRDALRLALMIPLGSSCSSPSAFSPAMGSPPPEGSGMIWSSLLVLWSRLSWSGSRRALWIARSSASFPLVGLWSGRTCRTWRWCFCCLSGLLMSTCVKEGSQLLWNLKGCSFLFLNSWIIHFLVSFAVMSELKLQLSWRREVE